MSDLWTDDAVRSALEGLPAWRRENDKLVREFRFSNFVEALGFIVRVGVESEKRGHHPELSNVYSRVTVGLTTHDAGGITGKDVDLAQAIDALVAG